MIRRPPDSSRTDTRLPDPTLFRSDEAVAEGVADQRQPDAGIARRPLDDDAAGPQTALLLGVAHDRECGPVLYRTAGIEELGLAENLAPRLLDRKSTRLNSSH